MYHILRELQVRKIFLPVYFVSRSPPEQRAQVLPSEKDFSEIPDGSRSILKESNIDRYMQPPSAIICDGKHSILANFCYAEFLAYYTLENNSSKICGYQPDDDFSVDNFMKNNALSKTKIYL